MLTKILTVREAQLGATHSKVAETFMDIALMYRYTRNFVKGKEYALKSFGIFSSKLGEEHPTSIAANRLVSFFEKSQQETGDTA
jgi:hypothetical protein